MSSPWRSASTRRMSMGMSPDGISPKAEAHRALSGREPVRWSSPRSAGPHRRRHLLRSPDPIVMSELIITCAAVETLTELNTFVLAMAEDVDGSGHRIELQRSLKFDDQDRALGLDTYCVCLASGASHYGGIRSCVLNGRRLSIEFTEEASTELSIEPSIDIILRVDEDAVAQVRDGLRRIFVDARGRPQRLHF